MAMLTHTTSNYTDSSVTNGLSAYKSYVEKAEFNRIGQAATAVAVQGCLLLPTLLLVMAYFGGGDRQVLVSMLSFLLIPILSAMPGQYIFPTFATSVLIHLAIILINLL